MRLGIQEDLLHGRTTMARFESAKEAGFDAVEVWADGLSERIFDLAKAIDATGVRICGVNLSLKSGYLSSKLDERDQAISRMRQAMADAIDLQAEHVIFVADAGDTSPMPDLTPYRTPHDLQSEMMVWLLRTVSDLAYALGVQLHMQPTASHISPFMTRLDQASAYSEKIKNHPHVQIAPHTTYMSLSEVNLYDALQTHSDKVGYLHIGEQNGYFPGQGLIDWQQITTILKEVNYDRPLVISVHDIGENHNSAYKWHNNLASHVNYLRQMIDEK